MQSGSGNVSWQAQIGSVKSWIQSSSSGHTFQSYLCSKLDLLLQLISCQEFFYQRLSFYLSPLLSLIWTLSALLFSIFFPLPSCPFLEADTEQKWLMLIKIRKQGDVRRLLGRAGPQTSLEPTVSPQQETLCPPSHPTLDAPFTKLTH